MTDVKVNLAISLPGGVMYSKQLCFKNSETIDKKGNKLIVETPIDGMTESNSFTMSVFDKETKKPVNKRFFYHTRKCIPVKQIIHLSAECYEYLISDSVPDWFRVPGKRGTQLASLWKSVSKNERLKLGLENIAASLNGTLLAYQVLDD